MKWEEIEQQYKGEWVFVDVTKNNEDYDILEAEVLCHDRDEETLLKKTKNFHPQALAIRYIGDVPEDWAVMV